MSEKEKEEIDKLAEEERLRAEEANKPHDPPAKFATDNPVWYDPKKGKGKKATDVPQPGTIIELSTEKQVEEVDDTGKTVLTWRYTYDVRSEKGKYERDVPQEFISWPHEPAPKFAKEVRVRRRYYPPPPAPARPPLPPP